MSERITGEGLRKILGNDIPIISQKEIVAEGCSVRKIVHADYYFEYGGREYIVEYNGDQHYKPVKFGSSHNSYLQDFEEQKIRDAWLREYCKKNSINLIEIDGRKYSKKKIAAYLKAELDRHFSLNSGM